MGAGIVMQINEQTRVLIIAAHPDDEVLAMGGTIARLKALNARVKVQFLGEGVSARFERDDIGKQKFLDQSKVRTDGARAALDSLRVDEVVFGSRLCCRFDAIDSLDIVKDIEETIADYDPSHIFTHNPIEVNIDHKITYNCVETAVRPKPDQRLRAVYGFEIVCSGNWTFMDQFKPTTYVDIKDYWQEKLNAWHCYKGENRPFPFPRSDIGLETLAKYRGMQAGMSKAEGFRVLREYF